ncbi:Ornithine carbamoyltransferase [Thioalkalivibrio nitratireducens DSM 14787]|uniref:Ornithine carbamoyltransferase n=1 Tax=Thioalkalivibrio nitratireducens (strain DSM 14787 / UNIQEM 213 / ALEN2) TaxID=1255043 RepID=L0DVA3_THIND|nr:ornithine carbamoyltransferase [Thioalkalivibrio nitratireducens]AGA32953.1 Ornithine carbamoyltransferase [Thioalkalivibrio nitratireducens DSM 14787]
MNVRHFLSFSDLSGSEVRQIIQRATELKRQTRAGIAQDHILRGKTLGMIFEKSSTRTRVSFEVGMLQLGGHALFLSPRDTQLGRGEPIEDTARVLSRMVDSVMIRTYEHEKIERFARFATVPVINGLTDHEHPAQLLADLQTYTEHRGDIGGRRIAWIGDGNNMCNSYILAARQLGFTLAAACPEGYDPDPRIVAAAGDALELVRDPAAATRDADLVVTDVWASMGQEDEKSARRQAFTGFLVDSGLMALARPDALFMHCLPAHREEEVTTDVLEGPQSVIWDEAENRLHAQKALIEFLLTGS